MNTPDIIGTVFGKNNQLTVISESEEKDSKGSYQYDVSCSVCHKDAELFTKPFTCTKQAIKKNHEICGCFKGHRYSEEQYTILVRRECTKRDLTFLGYDSWKNKSTKLFVKCNKCNRFVRHSVSSLLNGTGICRCANSNALPLKKKDDNLFKQDFYQTGAFNLEDQFWRENITEEWNYTCIKCSEDVFVKNGLCTGIFKTSSTTLKNGRKPCRCSSKYRWTEDQLLWWLQQQVEQDGSREIVYLEHNPAEISRSSVGILCKIHNEVWNTNIKAVRKKGLSCPCCARWGFKHHLPCSVYVIQAVNESIGDEFCGYGVTNDIDRRIKAHRKNLINKGFNLVNMVEFCIASGRRALEIEDSLQNIFPIVPQKIEGFKTEATHYYLLDEVVQQIEKLIEMDL